MGGRSLVELTEHDDSAADIMVHSTACTYHMYYCIHSALQKTVETVVRTRRHRLDADNFSRFSVG